jgi:hypothetical protein
VRRVNGEPREILKDFESVVYHYDDELAGMAVDKRYVIHDRFGLLQVDITQTQMRSMVLRHSPI